MRTQQTAHRTVKGPPRSPSRSWSSLPANATHPSAAASTRSTIVSSSARQESAASTGRRSRAAACGATETARNALIGRRTYRRHAVPPSDQSANRHPRPRSPSVSICGQSVGPVYRWSVQTVGLTITASTISRITDRSGLRSTSGRAAVVRSSPRGAGASVDVCRMGGTLRMHNRNPLTSQPSAIRNICAGGQSADEWLVR